MPTKIIVYCLVVTCRSRTHKQRQAHFTQGGVLKCTSYSLARVSPYLFFLLS